MARRAASGEPRAKSVLRMLDTSSIPRQDEKGEKSLTFLDPSWMATQSGKELVAVEVAHWLSHAPRFVAFGGSAFTAPATGGQRSSAHPQRAEALVVVCAGRDEGMRVALARITRAPDGSPRLGTWTQATTFADNTLFTEAIRLAFRMAQVRPAALNSHVVPLEWRGYHERRALAAALGLDPNLVHEEALIGEAA
jgi:hypothetical protein